MNPAIAYLPRSAIAGFMTLRAMADSDAGNMRH